MMFSYGSGCAASMFVLHFNKDYKKIAALTSDYKERLAQRRRVMPEEYDDVMAKRKEMFGKNDYTPQVRKMMLFILCRIRFLICNQAHFT